MSVEPQRIVVGVDGSDLSIRALRWALQYAEKFGGQVKAVIAWHFPAAYGATPINWDPELSAQTVLKESLDAASDVGAGVPIEAVVVSGWPANVLTDEAEGADLLVLGAKGHSPLARALLGSTSIHCISHARCSVMVVRG